jgi:hypothetical protein
VVAARDHVDARREHRVGGRGRQTHPAGDVLAVRGDEVDPPLVAKPRQDLLDRDPARLADQVADHQDPAGAVRPRRVSVRGVAEPRPPDGRRGPVPGIRWIAVSHPRTIPDVGRARGPEP